MSELMDQYWRLPVIARTFATTIFVVSLSCHIHVLPFHWFYFSPSTLFKLPPDIWRLPANFLITPPSLAILMDPYFLYRYISELENGRLSKRENLVWYLAFVGCTTIIFDQVAGFDDKFYLDGLIMALCYTCHQDKRGAMENMLFLSIPAQLVPYAIMFVTYLMTGPHAVLLQICGLLSAHLYDFLTRLWPEYGGGSNLLPTPAFLTRLVGNPVVRPSSANSGPGNGPLPRSWQARGGRRLGGE